MCARGEPLDELLLRAGGRLAVLPVAVMNVLAPERAVKLRETVVMLANRFHAEVVFNHDLLEIITSHRNSTVRSHCRGVPKYFIRGLIESFDWDSRSLPVVRISCVHVAIKE